MFLSEGVFDGYVSDDGKTYTPFPTAEQPGIQAGQGKETDLSGFVSFPTSSLGSLATVVNARLRLKQYTDSESFKLLGECMADIQKGAFNGNPLLEGADFSATETSKEVTEEGTLVALEAGDWVEAELDPSYFPDVNTTPRCRIR